MKGTQEQLKFDFLAKEFLNRAGIEFTHNNLQEVRRLFGNNKQELLYRLFAIDEARKARNRILWEK